MSINEWIEEDTQRCYICDALTTDDYDVCDECTDVESRECNACKDPVTPYDHWNNGGLCSRCDQEATDNWERNLRRMEQEYERSV